MINYTHELVVAKFMIIVHDYYYAIYILKRKGAQLCKSTIKPTILVSILLTTGGSD